MVTYFKILHIIKLRRIFMRKIVSVIGDAVIEKNGLKFKMAYETGKMLVDNGYRVQSGGMGGVMEAAFMGARASEKYKEGDTVALLPSFDANIVNAYADVVIPTGLDVMRNALVANASAVIAVGGGAGTLSEMALAWSLKRLIIAYSNVDGWSGKAAGMRLDERKRYPFDDDKIFGVSSADEAAKILNEKIGLYNLYHKGIIMAD